MIKAILGYDIEPGMTEEEYDHWLREVHIPDLEKIPGLRRIVFNTVKGQLRDGLTFYRIAELHYDSMEAFEAAAEWRLKNPISAERGPDGKTVFKFYVLCETEEVIVNP